MALIYIVEADNTQHPFPLPAEEGSSVTIGSSEDCSIPMPGIEGLAARHCSITLTGGEYVLADEGSENGTFEGERAIAAEPLREGVAYGIGAAYLYFYAEVPAAAEQEVLAEPIAVSEYAEEAPVEETPAEAPAEAEAAPAPVRKKKKKKPSALKQASRAMVTQKKQQQAMSAINYVYVLLVLAVAFYGGMTLRHWLVTGEYLPNFDSSPAKAVKK